MRPSPFDRLASCASRLLTSTFRQTREPLLSSGLGTYRFGRRREQLLCHAPSIEEPQLTLLPLQLRPAPEIARSYWRLDQKSTMLDVLEAVRSDEANHRYVRFLYCKLSRSILIIILSSLSSFVNHTLAELQPNDFNPFAQGEPPALIKGTVAGFSRDEAARFARDTRLALEQKQARPEQELLQQGFGGPSDSTKQTA